MRNGLPSILIPRPRGLLAKFSPRSRAGQLESAAIDDALERFGLHQCGPASAVQEGNRAQNAIVRTTDGKKVLRRYRGSLGRHSIDMEHSVLQKLASVDFPAPRLVPDATGQTLVEQDGHRYALFDFVENGYHFHHYILTPGQHRSCLESCAEALGVLHEKLQGFVPAGSNADGFTSYDSGRGRDLDWVLERLANSATVDPKDSPTDLPGGTWSSQGVVSELQQTFVELHARLTREDLPRSIIHADYGPYNILVRRGAPPVVLDFEMVRLDWKVVDLVRALYRFTHGRLGFDTDKMRCFVTAYCRESSLHPAERWWAPVVWRYTLVRQALLHWAEGRDAPTKTAESKLERSLYTLRWVASHQDELRALLGAQKNPSPTSAAKESREQPTLG